VNPIVRLQNVVQKYGDRQVLHGVDLEITAGESLGIAGQSGSGKSTMARLLTLHEDPVSGMRTVLGQAMERPTWEERRIARRQLQLVIQDPANAFAPGWTVRQILAEAGCVAPEGVLEKVHLPVDVLKRTSRELSGGEKRRLAIARALAVEPKLLVLDETLSGQDGLLRSELIEMLRGIGGITLVTVSHDLRLLGKLCERIAVMQEGKLVEIGRAEQVLRRPQAAITGKLLDAAFHRRSGV
jgi:peptide/nickel transport system ATP-binding protein